MNFLAHIYLSGDSELIKIGNFVADRIKGKQYIEYPLEMQKGIFLHRAIDTYTDIHEIFRQSKKRLVPNYNHYSGVIVDVFYDHFLAKNWNSYSDIPLEIYTQSFYRSLENNLHLLPVNIQNMIAIMISDDWLLSYSSIDGIRSILSRMDARTKYQSKMQYSTAELKEYYSAFEGEFSLFFEDIKSYVDRITREGLINPDDVARL